MATFFIFLCFFSFSVSASSDRSLLSDGARAFDASKQSTPVQQACLATRHPHYCWATLSSRVGPGSTMSDVIKAAFSASADNLKISQGMVQDILDWSAQDWNRSRAARTCLEGLSMSEHRTTAAVSAVAAQKLHNARAWTSAALSHQYGCWSGLKYVNNSAAVNSTMSFIDTALIVSTSNALSILRALDTGSWTPPLTERDGFWEPVTGPGPNSPAFNFSGLIPNVTVAKKCSDGCYTTVQDAVEAAPVYLKGGERFVIKIKEGVYEERVRVYFNKSNLVFLGDGIGKTVITGSLNAAILGISTYGTATVGVLGDGFMASGITFQNTAEPPVRQAVAFRSSSDYTFIENCEFLGYQDTLYAHTLRQFYKSCRIEGHIDFIFGNAAAILQDCTILIRPRQVEPEHGETNTIAAHGRTDPGETTGLVFVGCLINGTDDYMKLYRSKPSVHLNYLARPWKMFSRTIYINCTMEELINPEGWMKWDKEFALSTLYYGEFGNSGPGADLSKRVSWSSKIPEEHVSAYSFTNFLQGDEWVTWAS